VRILYVSPFPPARDGIGTYTETIVKELRSRGHEASVIAARRESAGNPDVLAVLPTGRSELTTLRDLVVDWQPDCIHVQFAVAAFGTRTLALLQWLRLMRSTGIPVVITMHEVTRDIERLRRAGRRIYRTFVGCCDHIIVHTRDARAECVNAVGVQLDKISVIPHPTASPPAEVTTGNELRVRFGLDNDSVLLAFGFIHVDKGLPDLVNALRIVHSNKPALLHNVRVVVAGAVRQRSGVFRLFELQDHIHLRHTRRLSQRIGVAQYILFTGYVPTNDIAGWFRTSSAVVLPYRRTEQSGVAALANAFEIPVLASAVGGLRDLYNTSKWAFPPRDPNALAQVLINFLSRTDDSPSCFIAAHPVNDLVAVVTTTIEVYHVTAGILNHRL
jgi:glycosyltransferase involved in cell wall biosynthesis